MICYFEQIIPLGDNLHEMPMPNFWKKYFKMLSTEFLTQYTER